MKKWEVGGPSPLFLLFAFVPVFFNREMLNAFFVPQTAYFVTLSSIVIALLVFYIRKLEVDDIGLILSAFFGIIILSLFISADNKSEAYYEFTRWYAYLSYYLSLLWLQKKNYRFYKKYITFLIFFAGIPILYGILQYYGIDFKWELKTNFRLISTFGNPNAFTQFAVLALPLFLYGAKKLEQRVFYIFFILAAFSIFLAGARIGLLILGIDAILILLSVMKNKRLRLGLLAAIVLSGILLFSMNKANRFFSGKTRLLIYRSSVNLLEDYPVLGVGPGNYKIIYQKYRSKEEHYRLSGEGTKVAKAHNVFLEYGAELGVLALALFILLLIRILFFKDYPLSIKLLFLNFLLNGLVSFNYLNTSAMFIFFTALTLQSGSHRTKKSIGLKINIPIKIIVLSLSIFAMYFALTYYMAEGLYTNAKRAEKKEKNYRVALRRYYKTFRFNHNYSDALKNISFLYWDKFKKYRTAIPFYRRFMRYSPYDYEVLHNIGFCYQSTKDKYRALHYYRLSLDIDPYYPVALGNIANFYYDMGNYLMAKLMYNQIIKLGYYSIAAYNNLGNTYQALGELQKSRKMYLKVLEINPTIFQTLYNLSYIEYKLGLYPDALKHITGAIERNPSFAPAIKLKNIILKKMQ